MLFVTSEAQAVPVFRVYMVAKGIYKVSTGVNPYDLFQTSNTSSASGSFYTSTWEGSHLMPVAEDHVNPQIYHREWTYGSGDYVRPYSRSCKMLIKY